MSSQTETNTNNRTSSDISDKKVDTSSICPKGTRKESSKKIPQEAKSREKEVESGEQTGNSVSTQNSLFNSLSELPNMSQTNKPTFSAVNSEKKIKIPEVNKKAIEPTDASISQMTKPNKLPNWDEASIEEQTEYNNQMKKYIAWKKKVKAESKKAVEEKPVQEEVSVDASVEDELEEDQKQDDAEQVQNLATDQFTASTLEVSVPFPNNPVEPLSAMDGVVKEDALKPMSSPPSQDVPLSALDFEEETSKPSADEPRVQFEEASAMEQQEQQETCMFCIEVLGDRKVTKCSFCSAQLCLGECSDGIINGTNKCPNCRQKYYRTEEEKFLDEMEAEEQERRRQFDLRRLEFLRKQKVQEEMNRATEIRQQKLADVETRKQEMIRRHREEMDAILLEEQRLTCMTDAEIVALQVQAISNASLITPERRAVIAPMRSSTPSRARATTPSIPRPTTPSRVRARASSPTPSNEGSRRGGSTAGRVQRTLTSMDIRLNDEFELALPRVSTHTWRIVCCSIAGKGSFRVLTSSNRPDVIGTTFSTGMSPFNAVFQEYAFSVGIPKQDRTPWKILNKYRGGVCIGKQM